MGTAGRQKLVSEWSPEVIAEKTAEVYRLAIADRRPAPRRSLRPGPKPSESEV